MLTAEQIKTLEEMGFDLSKRIYHSYCTKSYTCSYGNGTLYINDDNTFNITCYSGVYDLITNDLALTELAEIKKRAEEVILDMSHSRNVGYMGSYIEWRINYILKGEKK